MLQDFMNEFYNAESLAERGTVAQVKEMFGHRSLKRKVMANYQHVWDFVQVCLLLFSSIIAWSYYYRCIVPKLAIICY